MDKQLIELLRRLIENEQSLHQNIANDLGGGVLRCPECGHEIVIGPETIAQYLAEGWPVHCGRGMVFDSRREGAGDE